MHSGHTATVFYYRTFTLYLHIHSSNPFLMINGLPIGHVISASMNEHDQFFFLAEYTGRKKEYEQLFCRFVLTFLFFLLHVLGECNNAGRITQSHGVQDR